VSHSLVFACPVFCGGEIAAFAVLVAFNDIGGMRAGSLSPDCQEIFQEGIIVLPVRVGRDGVLNVPLGLRGITLMRHMAVRLGLIATATGGEAMAAHSAYVTCAAAARLGGLQGLDVEIAHGLSTSGLVVSLTGSKSGSQSSRTILLHGDMGALPMTEETGLLFRQLCLVN
jgi:hypothetical protein